MNLPKKHLSHSQITMYQRCPKQYEFRYIDDIIRPPSVALVEGSSYHGALKLNNMQKIQSHEDLPTKQVAECFAEEFTDRSKELETWDGETADSVIKRGTGLIGCYMRGTSPQIQPTKVEQEFSMPLVVGDETIEVVGFIDVEIGKHVIDYKGVKRTKSQADANDDTQLAIYAAATGADTAEFICLCKTKTPKVTRIKTTVGKVRKRWASQVMGSVAKAISAGVFPLRNPVGWECSERFCGFWHLCRGKRG